MNSVNYFEYVRGEGVLHLQFLFDFGEQHRGKSEEFVFSHEINNQLIESAPPVHRLTNTPVSSLVAKPDPTTAPTNIVFFPAHIKSS